MTDGLELTGDDAHDGIARIVTGPGSQRPLVGNDGVGGFVQTQQFPADGLIAAGAARNLNRQPKTNFVRPWVDLRQKAFCELVIV